MYVEPSFMASRLLVTYSDCRGIACPTKLRDRILNYCRRQARNDCSGFQVRMPALLGLGFLAWYRKEEDVAA